MFTQNFIELSLAVRELSSLQAWTVKNIEKNRKDVCKRLLQLCLPADNLMIAIIYRSVYKS